MFIEQSEKMRETIWDEIYNNGPCSVNQLAERLQINVDDVTQLIGHAWFSLRDGNVNIAITGE